MCSYVVVLPLYLLKFVHNSIEFFPTLECISAAVWGMRMQRDKEKEKEKEEGVTSDLWE